MSLSLSPLIIIFYLMLLHTSRSCTNISFYTSVTVTITALILKKCAYIKHCHFLSTKNISLIYCVAVSHLFLYL